MGWDVYVPVVEPRKPAVGRGRLIHLLLLLPIVVLAMLTCTQSATAADVSATASQEAPAIRTALARQLQQAGPSVVSQGGSGTSQTASGQPLAELSTAYSNTWQGHNGTRVTRLYDVPVNYRSPDGSWRPIDNALVASPLGGYENTANSFSLQLPESLQSSVSLSYEGYSLAFTLEGALTAQPTVSGASATYANVLPSTTLEYTAEDGGVREVATLDDTHAPQQLRYALTLPGGLSPEAQRDGSIAVMDSQDNEVFEIPAPVAYRTNAGPASGRTLPMSVTRSGSTWLITVDTSEAWLRESLASGPIAVDPSVTVSGSQACSITADTPKVGYCASTEFQVGYDSTHQEHHGLLEFNLSSIPQAALILQAKLGLYVEAKSTSNSKAVGVYRVTKPWTTSASWESYDGTHNWTTAGGDYSNPSENSDANVNSSVGASTGWYYWYPTKMLQEWVNTTNAPEGEGAANYGLIVKDQTDNVTQNLLTVSSPTNSSHQPYIEVIYNNRGIGVSPQYTQLSTALNDKLQMSVNVGSGDLMLANEDMHIAGIDGKDFSSTRYFNSIDPDEHDLGRWTESMFLQSETFSNGDVYISSGTGQNYVFLKQPNGSYLTPPGIKAKLCTSATTTEELCPSSLPSGVGSRLVYEDPEEDYVDFTTFGWVEYMGNKYGQKLTAHYTEGVDAITSWTDTRGRTIKYGVLSNSFYSEMKDEAGGRSTKYEYESEAKGAPLIGYTDANGKKTKYHYEYGNLNKITDAAGHVTKLNYDSEHRITEVTRVTEGESGPTTKFEYKKLGEAPSPCTSKQKATIVKDPDWTKAGEHESLYCINVLDEVEKTADATIKEGKAGYGNETQYTYNPFGEQISSTAATPGSGEGTGGVSNLNYDEAGVNVLCSISGTTSPSTSCPKRESEETKEKLVTSDYYHGKATKFSATQVMNPQGHSIFPCYSGENQTEKRTEEPTCSGEEGAPQGRLKTESNQLAHENELSFTYYTSGTENGLIKTSKDARGETTEYLYDAKGNLKEIKPPSGSGIEATKITVDADSRPEVITDGAGHKETITYDKDDRITKIVYSGTGTEKTVNFEYDADGNLLKREDPTGTVKYTVDDLNRLTKEELPSSVTHSYAWDLASHMESFTDEGGTTTYKYNGLNELESMTEPKELGTTHFAYDNDHRLDRIEYPSKAVESYKLQPATGRPEKITPEGVTGTTVPTLTYTYTKGENNQSQIQTMTESSSGATTSYSYNPIGMLTEAVTASASESRYAFELDGDGNRLKQEVNLEGKTGGTKTYYVPNSGNELVCRQTFASSSECSGSSSTELSHYTYDGAGEQLTITPKSDTAGTTFAYNAASELSTLTPSSESAFSLTYGGTGQDDLLSKGSSTTLESSLLGLTREVASSSSSYFERTPEGLLVDIRTPSGNYNPLYDAQGDIIGLVNSSHEVKRTFRYGPYGENVKSEGTQTVPFIFGYKGGYRMPGGNKGSTSIANGLYHFGQRYYDPTTGRWTQQDPESRVASPVQGNRFLFGGGNPINNSDPSGTEILEEAEEGLEEAGETALEVGKECAIGAASSVILSDGDLETAPGGCGSGVASYALREAGLDAASKALDLSGDAKDYIDGIKRDAKYADDE